MRLGLGPHAYRWPIGIGDRTPLRPLTPVTDRDGAVRLELWLGQPNEGPLFISRRLRHWGAEGL